MRKRMQVKEDKELSLSPTEIETNAILKAEFTLKPDIQPWLTEQCSRLKYGRCSITRCLNRGGCDGPPIDYDVATCEAYEVARALSLVPALYEALKNLVECKWVAGAASTRVDEARAVLERI